MTDHRISAFLFDFAGVLRGPTRARSAIYSAIEARYGFTKKVLKAELGRRGFGKLDAKQLAEVLEPVLTELVGHSVDSGVWRNLPDVVFIPANLELVRRLRPRYRIGMVANSRGTVEDRLRRHGVRELFDVVVDSGVVGVAKPDQRIFRLALTRLGLPPEECVFVDDKQANVEAAEAVGMHGVLFDAASGQQLDWTLVHRGLLDASEVRAP